MEQSREYRRRGTPDLPIAYYRRSERKTPHCIWHPELELILAVEGTVTMQLNTATRSFSAGDILIISPNQPHKLLNKSKGAVLRYLIIDPMALTMTQEHVFQKTFVDPLAQGRLELPELLTPEHPAYEKVLQQMQRLDDAQIYFPNYKVLRYSVALQVCMALLPYCRICRENTLDMLPPNEIARHCAVFIHTNYARKLTLGEIAAGCSVQPNYLCAVFKKYTDQTVMGYLNRTRVEAAAVLLQDKSISVAHVMSRVGFSTEAAFRENFRKYKGLTPRAYRKQLIGK